MPLRNVHYLTSTFEKANMTNDDLTVDDVRKMAADIGMTRLNDAQLQELLRSTRAARARRASLDTNRLTYADEPAHLFDLNR